MKEWTGYNFRTRTKCKIINPELIRFKNGRQAISGLAEDDRKTKVFRILSAAEAREVQQASG